MKKIIRDYTFIIIGSIIFSLSISALLVPSKIGVGGVTGIAMSLNKLFDFKIGMLTILINIPLFAFGYKLIGKSFAFKSAFVVVISSLMIDYFNVAVHFKTLDDMLLASIFCGVLFGIGVALIYMGGGSTGGLDILAKIITNKFQNLQFARVLLIQDVIIYLFVSYVFGVRSVMYALIMSFIRTKAIDAIQEGISSSKQCIIICEKAEEIIDAIQTGLVRGVTVLDAVGGYSKVERKFIYVVIQKNQLNTLRNLIKKIEPSAFVTTSEVNDILGNYRQTLTI
jgi:uncharacterized membrane-anchored protein YitT (DUF2179 family)